MGEAFGLDVAVIGGGPAGLMAASVLSKAGYKVRVFDAKPSVGRKFLMAGKSGLNITKSEYKDVFLNQYFNIDGVIRKALSSFMPEDVIAWSTALGVETFTGSTGRVFPKVMKASTLLRAWLFELSNAGVEFSMRHRWTGFDGDDLRFDVDGAEVLVATKVAVLALGGKSWARLGSDGNWQPVLEEMGIVVSSFRPSNCGFDCAWDPHFIQKFAGEPVKNIAISFNDQRKIGDFVITQNGIEGGAVYALSSSLAVALENGEICLEIDLAPDWSETKLEEALSRPRKRNSFSNHLRKTVRLKGAKAGLLRMMVHDIAEHDASAIARAIKSLRLPLLRSRPIDEAISTQGGVSGSELDDNFMIKRRPGLFVAGEMLDWDAPTGGYLITACLSTGKAAGEGASRWLKIQ